MNHNNCMPRLTFILIIIIICSSTLFYNLGNGSRTNKKLLELLKRKKIKMMTKIKIF